MQGARGPEPHSGGVVLAKSRGVGARAAAEPQPGILLLLALVRAAGENLLQRGGAGPAGLQVHGTRRQPHRRRVDVARVLKDPAQEELRPRLRGHQGHELERRWLS